MDETEQVEDEGAHPGYNFLDVACKNGHVESVKRLLAQGATPNASDYSSGEETREYYLRPALILAFPSVEIVRLLLEAGADPNCASEWAGERGGYKTSALSIAESKRGSVGSLLRRANCQVHFSAISNNQTLC